MSLRDLPLKGRYSEGTGLRRRFRNVDPFEPHGWRDMHRWNRERRASGWKPEGEPAARVDADVARLHHPRGPQATWIGHATYLLQLPGLTALTDPIWGDCFLKSVRRDVPAGIAWDDLPPVDVVLVSHNHYDHLDGATLKRLPRDTTICCPEALGRWFTRRGFEDVREVAWWHHTTVKDVDVVAVPAQHWSRRGVFDTAATHWCGWVLDTRPRVYFAGDTAAFSGFPLIGAHTRPEVALLPIGAYAPRWFMKSVHATPEEAVAAFRDVGARLFLPTHWGTFRLTDEPYDEPPQRLRAAWDAAGLPPEGLAIPAVGETIGLAARQEASTGTTGLDDA